ncbi:MAG: Rha family transcriptional regulator [Nitrosomonadales bacterium]
MQLALNLPNPLAARQSLFTDHGKALTTSRAVAERFGKQHKDVLRSVEKIIAELADTEFSQRNFAPSDFKNSRGKTFTEYRLTHDGFALLVMGFTGRDAFFGRLFHSQLQLEIQSSFFQTFYAHLASNNFQGLHRQDSMRQSICRKIRRK